MKHKRILIFSILILNLLLAGAVSATGLYNGSAAAVSGDAVKSPGVSYAILVGVSTYKDPSYNLVGVEYDVPHMKDMLINDCGYSTSRITTIEDSKATKSAIRAALLQMSSRAGKDDTVVFYFSGHGYVYPSYTGTSYIELYDSESDSVTNDISSSELKQWLDGVQCSHILVIIDACEAEGMIKGTTKELSGASLVKAVTGTVAEADRFSQNFAGSFESRTAVAQSSGEQLKAITGNQYVILVSCRSGESSWTNSDTGSWFTTYFVDGVGNPLADTNSDNWVSAEEAFKYASPLTTWKHYDQNPVMYDGDQFNELLMSNHGSSTTGTIDVLTSPAGAAIYLDGVNTGFRAPVTLPGVTAGTHTVRCSLSGYTEQSQSVTVIAGQTASVTITLQSQAPVTGSISVSSSPTGARIYLDGTDTGFTTPRTISGVTAGAHTVRCSLSGYTDSSQSVTVSGGRTSSARMYLARQAPVTGSISVSSSPTGARIYLDGTDTGFTTPWTISGVTAGAHTIRCSLIGYTEQSQSVIVIAGQTSEITLALQGSVTGTGSIYITSQPTKASVYLDGKYLGVYTPTTLSKIPAGTHTIRLTKYGYKALTQGVTVTAGTTTPVSVSLTP